MRRRNSGQRWRSSLKPFLFAGGGEGLARATSGPDLGVVSPSCEIERVLPGAEAGEEMAASKPNKVGCPDIDD
jgi:hypothetical protein